MNTLCKFLRAATSGPLILVYLFIGYTAHTDREIPSGDCQRIPEYSVNEETIPFAQPLLVSMDEHMRGAKTLVPSSVFIKIDFPLVTKALPFDFVIQQNLLVSALLIPPKSIGVRGPPVWNNNLMFQINKGVNNGIHQLGSQSAGDGCVWYLHGHHGCVLHKPGSLHV